MAVAVAVEVAAVAVAAVVMLATETDARLPGETSKTSSLPLCAFLYRAGQSWRMPSRVKVICVSKHAAVQLGYRFVCRHT